MLGSERYERGRAYDAPAIAPQVGPQGGEQPEQLEDRAHVERPPFEDGNLAWLKFGARSPWVYGKVAETISEG